MATLPATPQSGSKRLHTTADGLAGRMVSSIHRHADGFLWLLGPHSGLQRFDGKRFVSYAHVVPDSLREALAPLATARSGLGTASSGPHGAGGTTRPVSWPIAG
jgi:hypothetical protein